MTLGTASRLVLRTGSGGWSVGFSAPSAVESNGRCWGGTTASVGAVSRFDSAGELIGRHWQAIVPQADVELVQAETARRPADVTSQYEARILTKDGTETPVIVSARPLFEGDTFVGVLSAFTDITQRKQAEEALRRERDFSQSIIETTPALVVVLDADGHITLFNRACEELTGYTAAEAIGHAMWEFLIPERFIQNVQEVLSRIRADVPFSNYEIPLLTRDRNERWITWAHTNVKDGAGNVVAIVGVGVDVTDFRRMQQTLERRNRELQVLVEAGQLLAGTLDLDEVLDLAFSKDPRRRGKGGKAKPAAAPARKAAAKVTPAPKAARKGAKNPGSRSKKGKQKK